MRLILLASVLFLVACGGSRQIPTKGMTVLQAEKHCEILYVHPYSPSNTESWTNCMLIHMEDH